MDTEYGVSTGLSKPPSLRFTLGSTGSPHPGGGRQAPSAGEGKALAHSTQ